MFQENDVIIYGAHGVCQIVGTEEKRISGVKKTYYILKPIQDNGATIYAPVDNEVVRKKMRHLLTKDDINSLIDAIPNESARWIENDNERKERYRNILASGDHAELLKMVKAIYLHKKEREAEGKRLHMIDEHFFKDAEQMLYNEFQYVLQLQTKEDIISYIFSRIEN